LSQQQRSPGLGSPGEQTAAIAVPAPIVAISSPSIDSISDERAAERAAAKARDDRKAIRAKLTASKHAAKRAKSLGLETQAIAAQQARSKLSWPPRPRKRPRRKLPGSGHCATVDTSPE
jgi:hypothetical protein